jgi:hypothetical protein
MLRSGVKMNKLAFAFLIGTALFHHTIAMAEDRAVNVSIGSTGGRFDSASLQKVRKVIGKGFAEGAVDTVYVYTPREGGPIFIEGGMSVCVEAGFGPPPKKFTAFVEQLRSIHPLSGTFYNVELTAACKPVEPSRPLTCGGIRGEQCPDKKQYCDFGVGQCQVADAQGTCKAKPEICPEIFQPVCGCNGETYPNACDAARAGVSVDHPGECKRQR